MHSMCYGDTMAGMVVQMVHKTCMIRMTLMIDHFEIKTGLKENDTSLDLAEFMKLRGNPKRMMIFCNHFLSCIVGKVEWKEKSPSSL